MDTSALSSSSLATPPIAHPPNDNTSSAETTAATPIQPTSVESSTVFHPFIKDETVQPLTAPERGRVVSALKTGITWIKQAIAALAKPFSKETQDLMYQLIPDGLMSPLDRAKFKGELTRTMDGMQKMVDQQASNVGTSEKMHSYAGITDLDTGEMHLSSEFLANENDQRLTSLLIHEASHAYAKTKDNWKVTPHGPPTTWDSIKTWFSKKPAPKFDKTYPIGKDMAPFTTDNAIENSYTLQYSTEILAGHPYESLK